MATWCPIRTGRRAVRPRETRTQRSFFAQSYIVAYINWNVPCARGMGNGFWIFVFLPFVAIAIAGCCCCVCVPGLLLFGVQKDGWWGMDPLEQMMLYLLASVYPFIYADARCEWAGQIYTFPSFCLNRISHGDCVLCSVVCVLYICDSMCSKHAMLDCYSAF